MNLFKFINSGVRLNQANNQEQLVMKTDTKGIAQEFGCEEWMVPFLAKGNPALRCVGENTWEVWNMKDNGSDTSIQRS